MERWTEYGILRVSEAKQSQRDRLGAMTTLQLVKLMDRMRGHTNRPNLGYAYHLILSEIGRRDPQAYEGWLSDDELFYLHNFV